MERIWGLCLLRASGGRADWVVYFLGGSALAFLDYSRLEILILIRLHFFRGGVGMRAQADRPPPTRCTQPLLIVDFKALCTSTINVVILPQSFAFKALIWDILET